MACRGDGVVWKVAVRCWSLYRSGEVLGVVLGTYDILSVLELVILSLICNSEDPVLV